MFKMNFKYCYCLTETRAICLVRMCQFLIFICIETMIGVQSEQWKYGKNLTGVKYGSFFEPVQTSTDSTLFFPTTKISNMDYKQYQSSPFNRPPLNSEEVARLQAEIIRLSQLLSFYDRCYNLMHDFVKQCYGPADFIQEKADEWQSKGQSYRKSMGYDDTPLDQTSVTRHGLHSYNSPNRSIVHKPNKRENRKKRRQRSRKQFNKPIVREPQHAV